MRSGSFRIRWVTGLACAALACQTQSFGIWIEPPPPVIELPVPLPFEAAQAPKRVPTGHPGLVAAPHLDGALYYYEPHERWYRHAFNRWYEAFAWDGHWFEAERVPEPLRDGPLVPPEP